MNSKGLVAIGIGVLVSMVSAAILVPTFFGDDPNARRIHPGLDLQGGALFTYDLDVPADVDAEQAAVQAATIVRHRLAEAELEANVRRSGSRIYVEIPGNDLSDFDLARRLVAAHAGFEMRMVDESARPFESLALPAGVERAVERVVENASPASFLTATGDAGRQQLLDLAQRHSLSLAVGQVGTWEESFDPSVVRWRTYVVKEARITGSNIDDANVVTDSHGMISVAVSFDGAGAEALHDMTHDVGSRLAIIVNDEVVSAPMIQSPIPGGRAQITLGRLDTPERRLAEAHDLAVTLRAGALPNPFILESEDIVPAAQRDVARAIGGGSVLLFVLALIFGMRWYRLQGIALALPLIVTLAGSAALALMNATANVSQLAGISLTGVVALGAATVAIRHARQPATPKLSRLLAMMIPAASCFVLLLLASMSYRLTQGPMRGAAMAIAVTSMVGVPLAAIWMYGAMSSQREPVLQQSVD